MNPDSDVTYQKVNVFSSDKCFISFISDVPPYIWWNQQNTVYTILVKVDILVVCGTMICSYFVITFLLFIKMIEIVVLQILPKISNEHIKLTPYSKMNIRLAAQVLSSVSKVLFTYSPPEAAETACFWWLIDWFFDIMNIQNNASLLNLTKTNASTI